MLGYLALGILLVALIHVTGKRLAHTRPSSFRAMAGAGWVVLVLCCIGLLARLGYPRFALLLGGAGLVAGAIAYGVTLRSRRAGRRPRVLPQVATGCLLVTLNPASGSMRLEVTQGAFLGQTVDELDEAELKQLYGEIQERCADSLDVFQTWLRHQAKIDWHSEWDMPEAGEEHSPGFSVTLTDDEARRALGIAHPSPGARTVQAAHRRLMRRFHPDKGGGIFMATVFNVARDQLLQRTNRKKA